MTQAIAARDYQNLIDGRWVDAADGRTSERMSPAHDVVVGRYPAGGVEDLDRAVAAARKAFDDGPWPRIAGVERARVLNRVAEAIRADADDLAYVEALESGKPISQALDEIVSSADLWEYAATPVPPHLRRHLQHARRHRCSGWSCASRSASWA